LVQYLKQGVAPGRAVVAGPMAEVVHTSLSYLTDADLNAIAAYLKASPAKTTYAQEQVAAPRGANQYLTNCAFCHQADGRGIAGAVPPLVGNGVVKAGGADDVIRTILGGLPAQGGYAPMPGYATSLTSGQVAEIANYVRISWGNGAPPNATPGAVDALAKQTRTMMAGTGECAPPGPPALAQAMAAPDVQTRLHAIGAANMLEQIDAILPKLRAADAQMPQADLVNGLVAAYCPIARADTSGTNGTPTQLLQRFAMLVYSQIADKSLGLDQGASQHASVPAAAKPN